MAGMIVNLINNGSERTTLVTSLNWRGDASKPPVVYCHGRFGGSIDGISGGTIQQTLNAITDAGYPIIMADLGGGDTWSNDAALAAIGAAKTLGQSAVVGGKTGKVPLLAVSMGGASSLSFARANPSLVSSVSLLIPAPELEYLHDNNCNNGASSLEAAFGGLSGYNAALPTRSPKNFASEIVAAGIPTFMARATNENAITSAPGNATPISTLNAGFMARQHSLAVALGSQEYTMTAGHTLDQVPIAALTAFLNANS